MLNATVSPPRNLTLSSFMIIVGVMIFPIIAVFGYKLERAAENPPLSG
jgi:hypothetical protein